MTVLITGGAGYIGSHCSHALGEAGIEVAVLDDLSTGAAENLPSGCRLIVGDVGDAAILREILVGGRIDAVMHFAGSIVVPESVVRPLHYYTNNTQNSLTLVKCCLEAGVRNLVFSSTASVYGHGGGGPFPESAALAPGNPYAGSKAMSEAMMLDAHAAHGLSVVILRYFNVAGADPAGRTGQSGPASTHLIRVACEAALGKRDHIDIHGTDYPTPDGTCIRDYVHVTDLADAHLRALRHLLDADAPVAEIFNCGTGRGYSVREILAAITRIHGRELDIREVGRRSGDPASLIADAARLRRMLGWNPRFSLDDILTSALTWEQRQGP